MVAGRGARRPQRRRDDHRDGDRRRNHRRRETLSRRVRRRRRDRTHHDRSQRSTVQMRQLWVPRGVCLRAGDRHESARGARSRRDRVAASIDGKWQARGSHGRNGLPRGVAGRRGRERNRARHRALPRCGDCQLAEYPQCRRRRGRRRCDPRRRRVVHSASRRSPPTRLSSGGRRDEDRAWRAAGNSGSHRCRRDVLAEHETGRAD